MEGPSFIALLEKTINFPASRPFSENSYKNASQGNCYPFFKCRNMLSSSVSVYFSGVIVTKYWFRLVQYFTRNNLYSTQAEHLAQNSENVIKIEYYV